MSVATIEPTPTCPVTRVEDKGEGRYVIHVRELTDEPEGQSCSHPMAVRMPDGSYVAFSAAVPAGAGPADASNVARLQRALPYAWTPAAVAELCNVPPRVLADWHALGFIRPDDSGLYPHRHLLAVRVAAVLREQGHPTAALVCIVKHLLHTPMMGLPSLLLYSEGVVTLRHDASNPTPPEVIVPVAAIAGALFKRCSESALR